MEVSSAPHPHSSAGKRGQMLTVEDGEKRSDTGEIESGKREAEEKSKHETKSVAVNL